MTLPAATFLKTVDLLRSGQNIEAIKLIRDAMGLTLQEANELINAIAASIKYNS